MFRKKVILKKVNELLPRPNKNKCVSGNVGKVGIHIFNFFFWKPETILGFTNKFRLGRVTLNTGIIFIWPEHAKS